MKVCVDLDFDSAAIKAHFSRFEVDDKYKGIQDYEWNETETKQ